MAKHKIIILCFLAATVASQAQTPRERYEAFKKQAQQQYEDFRSKANKQYADFIRQAWQQYHANAPIQCPNEEPVPPIVCPEEDGQQERVDEPKPFEEVVVIEPPKPQPQPVEPVHPIVVEPQPSPIPQPQPVEPVHPIVVEPQPSPKPVQPVKPQKDSLFVTFYGTRMPYFIEAKPNIPLSGTGESAISDAWRILSNGQFDDLLVQCLNLRKQFSLNDWAYIQLLDKISSDLIQSAENKSTLLMAWLYCQSGYKMRLARKNDRLYMLFASDNIIYNHIYYLVGNSLYYPYKGKNVEYLNICDFHFPNEQTMTLEMCIEPFLSNRPSTPRVLQSERYPSIQVASSVNQNLIDFYNDYPTGAINNDSGTRWAIYANAPLSDEARQSLYPQLKKLLEGKSRLEATEQLLNFVQTAFVYEYDEKVWGDDRGFFAEETLFYPYADCEDRAVLFSRMVRDLLNLKVVLLYYPGHVAAAVRFEEEQPLGDYLELTDGHYYIADPTYYGATVGMSMPKLRDEKIRVIVLQ